MEPIPKDILTQFDEILKRRDVPISSHADYRKWLRYFLDYRAKYSPPEAKSDQVRLFAEKLRSKNQTAKQVEEAADAVSLLFALQQRKGNEPGKQGIGESALSQTHPHLNPPLEGEETAGLAHRPLIEGNAGNSASPSLVKEESGYGSFPSASDGPFAPRSKGGNRYDEWRCLRKTESPAWDKAIADLAAEIKLRHLARNTLKAYANWSRKFQSYLKDKQPETLSSAEVKAYLTYLAVDCKVSSSHQDLAFNALLFLYRHVLSKDFGTHKDIPRAKTSNYIPTVLSRRAIDVVLN